MVNTFQMNFCFQKVIFLLECIGQYCTLKMKEIFLWVWEHRYTESCTAVSLIYMHVKWHSAVLYDLKKYLVIQTKPWDCTNLLCAKRLLINTVIFHFYLIPFSLTHQEQWRESHLEQQERSWGLWVTLWLGQGEEIKSTEVGYWRNLILQWQQVDYRQNNQLHYQLRKDSLQFFDRLYVYSKCCQCYMRNDCLIALSIAMLYLVFFIKMFFISLQSFAWQCWPKVW